MIAADIYQLFHQEINQPDEHVNLAKTALYFSKLEYPDLDIEKYLNTLDIMAEKVKESLPESMYPLKVIQTINHYLFEDLSFRGNTTDYYDPRNSYLNEVIERRTGIPITLSVIYLEVAKRINFPMVGIGLPGHFIIRPNFDEGEIFVDPFFQGEILFDQDCEKRLSQVYQQPVKLEAYFLKPITNQQILVRMLTNLKSIYLNRQKLEKALRIVNLILLTLPNHPLELRDRGLLYYQLGAWEPAKQDLGFYLALLPNAQDAEAIRQLLQKIG